MKKTDLFKREEALILGYMLSKYFSVPKSIGFSGSYGNKDSWSKCEDTQDGSGNYENGRNGKPPYKTANGDLVGSGGTQSVGGWGLKNGLFGQGGNGASFVSSGGGGGFYGGGSSYHMGGGGGGSSFVWKGDLSVVPNYMVEATAEIIESGFTEFNPVMCRGCSLPLIFLGNIDYCFNHQPNYSFSDGFLEIKQVRMDKLYTAGGINLFTYYSNFIMPEEYSETYEVIDGLTGQIDTVDESGSDLLYREFEFQRGYIELEVPRTGFYHIKAVGAQGGGSSSRYDTTSHYVGGCGGMIEDLFFLQQGLKLYILIGEEGNKIRAPQRPQGFGGGGAQYSGFAGGGQTAVFLKENDFYSRLIVAGGGGGAGGLGTDNDEEEPETEDDGNYGDRENKEEDKFSTGKQMFIISDLSIAYVDLTYKCSYDGVEDKTITVSLYVDGVKRGVQTLPAIAGGGFQTFTFDNFDQWLPPNTTPYWAALEAVIETDLPQMTIPQNGCIIRVETKTRPNDCKPILEKLFGYFKFKAQARSFLKFFIEQGESGKGDLKDLEYINTLIQAEGFAKIFIKVVRQLKLDGVSYCSCSSFMKILIKTIKKLHNSMVNKIGINPYIWFFFGDYKPDEPKIDIFHYITSNVGVGSYSSFFMEKKENLKDLTSATQIQARSFMRVDIKTVPTLNITTISTVQAGNAEEIKVKEVPELKINAVSTVNATANKEIIKGE